MKSYPGCAKMGSIIRTKKNDAGVILEVKTDYEEYLELQGHLENIHLIAETNGVIRTNISQRGANGATKYFLIPRELRKGFQVTNTVSCHRTDKEDKVIFVYIVDKLKSLPSRRELVMKKFSVEQEA